MTDSKVFDDENMGGKVKIRLKFRVHKRWYNV